MTHLEEYWLESFMEIMHSIGITDIPVEKQEEAAKSLAISAQCQSLAFYSPSSEVGRFETSEVKELKRKLTDKQKELDTMTSYFKQNVASRHRCSVNEVILGRDGEATIERI